MEKPVRPGQGETGFRLRSIVKGSSNETIICQILDARCRVCQAYRGSHEERPSGQVKADLLDSDDGWPVDRIWSLATLSHLGPEIDQMVFASISH